LSSGKKKYAGTILDGDTQRSPLYRMMVHLLKWTQGRLDRIYGDLKCEFERDNHESVEWHREQIIGLVARCRRKVVWLEASGCKEDWFVLWLEELRELEIYNGRGLFEAGIMEGRPVGPPDDREELVERWVEGDKVESVRF